jgi:hypothetical protein
MRETYESPEDNKDDQQLRSSGRPYVHWGFIWTSGCCAIGPAVGRVSADLIAITVVPVANSPS